MESPVILKSGVTYEKDTIIQSLNTTGNFDPVTRQEINPNDPLISNKALKQATDHFLS